MKALFFSQDSAGVEQLALALRIRWRDLEPIIASQGQMGLEAVEREEPDIVILCEDLPDMDIFSVIREIRRFSDIPIVLVSEAEDDMQGIKALEMGADDFISARAGMMVIMVKVVALMRRVNMGNRKSDDGPIQCGELLIDPAGYEVYLGSKPLRLTPTEFRLLYLLAKNRHITLSQNFIRNAIWSDEIADGSKVKKYIQRLRRKLEDDAREPKWIRTVHGMGYRMTPPVSESDYAAPSDAA